MKSTFFLAALITGVCSAPTPTFEWTTELGAYFKAVSSHVKDARAAQNLKPLSCDLSKAIQPTAPTPLPSPAGLKLSQVVIGRGVQNYTCAGPTATPVAIGAIANLYDVSCMAANYPDILNVLPALALQYPLPADPNSNLQPSNIKKCGHHYFSSTGVPTFNLNDDPQSQLGVVTGKVANKSSVPAFAVKGQLGLGDGAVPWLLLTATNTTSGNIKSVYRLNTAGGQPPKDCSSSPAVFSVQYATEYWFYS